MRGTPLLLNTLAENVAPYAAQTAFARLAVPEEVANANLFLASDEASYYHRLGPDGRCRRHSLPHLYPDARGGAG